jgi:hypothetical protein
VSEKKSGLLQVNSLLISLKEENAAKEDFEKQFLHILHQEKAAVDRVTAIDFVQAVLEFNQIGLHDMGLAFILNTLEHHYKNPLFYKLWKLIEDNISTYEPLMEFIALNPDYKDILDPYLNEKLDHNCVEDILNEVDKLLLTSPFLVKNKGFQTNVIKKTAYAVGDSSDIFKAASVVKEFRFTNPEDDFSKLKDMMMVYSEIALLDEIDLQSITLHDIDSFKELTTGKLNTKEIKDKRIISKYKIMKVLVELFSSSVVSVGLVLPQLSLQDRNELREVLKNILPTNLQEKYFQHLLAAFDNEDGSYHYTQLFSYLGKNADDTLIFSFIKWTANHLRIDHHYHRGLKSYLITHPRSVWKNKIVRKELQSIPSSNFRKLVKEVQNEKANLFFKFFKKYGFQCSIVALIILVLGSGGYYAFSLIGNKDTVAASKNKEFATSEQVKKEEVSADPFREWTKDAPLKVSNDQIVLTFGEVNPEGGKSIVLKESQNIETKIELPAELETSPFDENGVLLEGYQFYGTEHDFDQDGTPEIVITAKNITLESFVWVYSYNSSSEQVENRLVPKLAIKGMDNAQLEDNKLSLLTGGGYTEVYSFENQEFVKQ